VFKEDSQKIICRETQIPARLQGQTYELDFLCFEKIIVGIKAVKRLADEYERFVNQSLSRFLRVS
jgi:hypothetical protein